MVGKNPIVIDSSSEDEDEDLKRAIALSLQSGEEARADEGLPCKQSASATSALPARPGLGGLDRRKMEEDRLARIQKRKPESPQQENPAKRHHAVAETRHEPRLKFPQPVVKRTWAFGYPRTGDDVKIEEIFDKKNLQLALLSSFTWDEEWLLTKVDVRNTRLMLLAYANDEETKAAMQANTPSNIRFCFPKMNGPGAMHSKLQVLKFPNHLRIAIPTGNLMSYDWGETGVMENMVFLVDLPRLPDKTTYVPTMFSNDLCRFLEESGVDERMISSLQNYDFAATSEVAFVYSRPGSYMGDNLYDNGCNSLAKNITALGLTTVEPVEIDLICSSLGSLNFNFISTIYDACLGTKDGQKTRKRDANDDIMKRFRVYFPTNGTVAQSKGGKQSGGTICVQSKWWNASTFPKGIMRDCINTRAGILSHSKVIYVRYTSLKREDKYAGWAYVGSSNLSESAWGKIVTDKATKQAKITCRNWECGVVMPLANTDTSNTSMVNLKDFERAVPVPMQQPPRPYAANEQPWFFQGP
ncbi:hypothetical protein VHEMI01445 [[Torrubiella] hemipterigena]|uniref:PLD phosphodiesterase domain-containing protein n=1 Tax=[Torrubiella] hemipterigena TaxID=1531966 RepID=A0A0A1T7I4_9HYPO|nr:hypothetical protein VHEMI01445 [[Torrubiella] hemipterigena]